MVSEDESDSDSSQSSSISSIVKYRNYLLSKILLTFSPLSLKMICRNVIRSEIIDVNSTSQVMKIYSLPLPNSLKEFVGFANVPTTYTIR